MSAPYALFLKGTFVIEGKRPDGDTVRFVADSPAFSELQRAYRIKPSKSDSSVNIRLEGIDAPETHYGVAEQPLGMEARDRLLEDLGYSLSRITFDGSMVVSADGQVVRGAILSCLADPNGRLVAYCLPERNVPADAKDGSWVPLDADLLQKTVNYALLQSGAVYYTAYTSMPERVRAVLRAVTLSVRDQRKGIWQKDSTPEFALEDAASLGPHGSLILPKLFRRCTDYLKELGSGFRGNLTDWLRQGSGDCAREDDRVVVSDMLETRFSELLTQSNSRILFKVDPLDLVFVEK